MRRIEVTEAEATFALFKKRPTAISAVKEKEETMRTEQEIQRDYLSTRAYQVIEKKCDQGRIKFGLDDEKAPMTIEDLKDRLNKGRYKMHENWSYNYTTPMYAIRWRDPSVKEDYEGYTAWYGDLNEQYTAIKDKITIAPPDEALKAIQEWEAAPIQ